MYSNIKYATIDKQRYLSKLKREDFLSAGLSDDQAQGSPAYETLRRSLGSMDCDLPLLYKTLTANVESWAVEFILPQLMQQCPAHLRQLEIPLVLVITVPCAFTVQERLAWAQAIKSGFPPGCVIDVHIVTKPHAAMLELMAKNIVQPQVGVDYVVCDIGGSTMVSFKNTPEH